jgi:hypothetical protein
LLGLSECVHNLPKDPRCLFPAYRRVELKRLQVDSTICEDDEGITLIIIEQFCPSVMVPKSGLSSTYLDKHWTILLMS